TLIALIISDVVGDPLDIIASGPTVADSSTPAEALEVLRRIIPDPQQVPDSIWSVLETQQTSSPAQKVSGQTKVFNQIIGSNATALTAAKKKAEEAGYAILSLGSENEGTAYATGIELAELCLKVRDGEGPVSRPACLLSGGEPVVDLSSAKNPGKGGRNQEVVLSAMQRLWEADLSGICILSGGTDGEDGPTDAAGGILDSQVLQRAHALRIDPAHFLKEHNSYPCLVQIGGLLKTGATQTNVMDLRVALVE
ncbi:MAG: DUF4147 domain-containing protein, partial [Planctomycetaceae bacterium]|nr:DUF4147 domain-containing protein [Planctomycetaceae bacterium]